MVSKIAIGIAATSPMSSGPHAKDLVKVECHRSAISLNRDQPLGSTSSVAHWHVGRSLSWSMDGVDAMSDRSASAWFLIACFTILLTGIFAQTATGSLSMSISTIGRGR